MTRFEWMYLCAEPFFPPLNHQIRGRLKKLTRGEKSRMEILDVGGRLSNYTIGLPANITVTDLPRNTEIQKTLYLGNTDQMITRLLARRSNVVSAQYDDMTRSNLPDEAFDCVVAVEVLEHVELDDTFVSQVVRVLKPNRYFLMTTPNGEFVRNVNPDHKRHYTRAGLTELLSRHFEEVEVEYAVRHGYFYGLGLRSWTWKHPIRTAMTMLGGLVSGFQSFAPPPFNLSHQLIAIARKRGTA